MFDIGFSELLVIGLVALIVIGPERLPRVALSQGNDAQALFDGVEGVAEDRVTAIIAGRNVPDLPAAAAVGMTSNTRVAANQVR